MTESIALPRILHLIDSGVSGGAETVFATLAQHAEARAQNVAVVVPHEGWLVDELHRRGVTPCVIPSSGSFMLGLVQALVRMGRAGKADVISAHLLGSAVYGAAAGLILRVPVIAVFHGAADLGGAGRMIGIKRWLLRQRYVHVVAVSEGVKTALVEWGLATERIIVVRNGVDTAAFSPGASEIIHHELGLPPETRIVGFVGNLDPPKAYDTMLEAARQVLARAAGVAFVVYGGGSDTELERLRSRSRQMAVADRVHFAGFKPATAERYRSFAALGSSSSSEGLPLSFLEAMACGIPIAATDNEGSGPLLRETGAGLLSPVGDAQALAENLVRLLGDRELAGDLGAAGRRAVCERFSLDSTLAQYDALYAALTGKDKRRG